MQIREELGPLRRRAGVLVIAVLVALGMLHLRMVQLQLVGGSHWRRMAENNRLRRLPLPSARGRIFDRRGMVLADNLPTWVLLLFPDEAANLDRTALFLARAGIADVATLRGRFEDRRGGRLAPLIAAENLSWEQVARIRAHQSDHPELSIVEGFRRFYPYGETVAHAVGYLRLVSPTEVDRTPDLDPNALVGASGIETLDDAALTGHDGERIVVVSAVGRQLGVVKERLPRPGPDLGSTLDVGLQEAARAALGDSAGAIVGLDPRSGAVRILYSSPSFDPNLFVGRLSRDDWLTLADDPGHPLQNRCVQGVYPPGSTIKPFMALAGLGESVISPAWGVTCNGSVNLYNHRFRCWQRWGHGKVGLERSLEVSCDVFYYLLGQRLGIENIARWLRHFGFGTTTGIGLNAEASGLIGTPEWSERVRGTPWYPGEAVSVSIGQGPLLVTVLQLARGYAALANGGRLVVPRVVEPREEQQVPDLDLDPEQLSRVVAGLTKVVHGLEGTARRLGSLPIVGKTGTAQVAQLQEGVDSDDLAPHLRHHAWFVGWAPLETPELVVAVVVEHGGGGSSVAAPAAGSVFRLFVDQRNADRPSDPERPAPTETTR
jgi:penicillin-binding protein 2